MNTDSAKEFIRFTVERPVGEAGVWDADGDWHPAALAVEAKPCAEVEAAMSADCCDRSMSCDFDCAPKIRGYRDVLAAELRRCYKLLEGKR